VSSASNDGSVAVGATSAAPEGLWIVSASKSIVLVLRETVEEAVGNGTLPPGGTDGQVLTKQSASDGDADWETPSAGDLSAHLEDTADAHDASAISFVPAGTIAATDVQAAIEEVASGAVGGSAATVVHMGNLGASGTADCSSDPEVWVIVTLTANGTLTLSNVPTTGLVKLLVTQNGTGGWDLSVDSGSGATAVSVNADVSAQTVVDLYFYPSGSPYADEVLADNPVSYWRLGEAAGTTADDELGVNAGTYVGTITLGATGALTGDSNTAVDFDPSDSVITVADSASLDVGDVFTLEAWVNRDGVVGSAGGIISKQFNGYAIEDIGSGTWRFSHDGVGTLTTATSDIPSTGWHHLVATKNGATINVYLDGVDVTGATTDSTIVDNASTLWIGRSGQGRWYGKIDEVAIYDTALSGARVAAHYAAGT
jgi:hypothetical protein